MLYIQDRLRQQSAYLFIYSVTHTEMVRGELLQSHESTKLHVQKDADDL